MSLLADFSRALSPELPKDLGNMDEHLDFIIPKVMQYGEDLREEQFWLGRRWKEVRDEEGFHESILHIFNPGGEYLMSFDGNILKGAWRKLDFYNTLILEVPGRSELFDLRFLDGNFMILSKHGDQGRKNQRRYFCLVHEPLARIGGRDVDWRNLMEMLFNVWRQNSVSLWTWAFFVVVLGVILYLSFR